MCLSPEKCYILAVKDSDGDGLISGNGFTATFDGSEVARLRSTNDGRWSEQVYEFGNCPATVEPTASPSAAPTERTFQSVDEENSYYNAQLRCPFPSLAPAEDGDEREVVLDVYSDSSTFRIVNGQSDSTSNVDDEPTTTVIVGQGLFSEISGCRGDLAVQRQGDEVCFSYSVSTSMYENHSVNCRSLKLSSFLRFLLRRCLHIQLDF